MTGERLSHYLVLERLDEGSRTIVFKADFENVFELTNRVIIRVTKIGI